MKYLKRFNEKREIINKDVIRNFCEENLAYLIDDGFQIRVTDAELFKKGVCISIKRETGDMETFSWNDIKDDLIPFIQILGNHYVILDTAVNRLDHKGAISVDTESLLNDTIENVDKVFDIRIKIRNYKNEIH